MAPDFREAGTELLPAIQPYKALREISKEQTLAVVARVKRIRQIDRIRQGNGEGIERLGGLGYQQAGVCARRGRWSRSGLGGAAGQGKQENAAGSGEPYDSATTNGLPPSFALISGTAAAASVLVAYSPTRTL